MNEETFLHASPGERITYHVGFLACDRQDDPELHGIASMLMRLESRGTVDLVQRRLGRGRFAYVAVRRRRRAYRRAA